MKLGDLLEMSNGDTPVSRRGMAGLNIDAEMAKRRSDVIEWLDNLFPGLRMPVDASEEELQARLLDGSLLCGILRRLSPGYSNEMRNDNYDSSLENSSENITKFVSAVENMGLPGFNVSDLEQGAVSAVVYCLWSLKDHLLSDVCQDGNSPVRSGGEGRTKPKVLQNTRFAPLSVMVGDSTPRANDHSPASIGEQRRHSFHELRSPHYSQSTLISEPSTPQSPYGGHKFHDVFQLKQGHYYDISASKISDMMKSNSLDNAPTQSLLSIMNGILEESIERKNQDIPQRVSSLLKRVVQEIERRIATQAEHIHNQNNLIKTREEKYQSRIRVLEALAMGTNEETQIVMEQLQLLKTEKHKIEEKNTHDEENIARLLKEKEKNDKNTSELAKELETVKRTYKEQYQHMETKSKEHQEEFEQKLIEVESYLEESRSRMKELEAISESKTQNWNHKEHVFQKFINLQQQSVKELRSSYDSIKHELAVSQKKWCEESITFGKRLKVLIDAAENYHSILAENRKLFNEVQELKGNIRVYCRIRPFHSGEDKKHTTIEYIGENGELLIANPSKQRKVGQRMFKFNKVFGPASTQEEVFLDIQPLIRSVLDGYNVCILAYGQTGSGKTYTMSGPNGASDEEWGVNYRALNDLFQISRNRRDTYMYEVGVQMIEIYNEQVRDLLANDGSQKKLGILNALQPNGLAVPDASMHPVASTNDVLELMQMGNTNRVVGATALNERSSRSHSIMTVHVRGVDLKTGATLRGSLHLVDLAGSERVERSEAIGDRLKEAQHINRSLSALGDVIFSLSQKNSHVPYRNSKLTQILQSSLGGHAKTLMFVQINPAIGSYSETLSTLKFAERVSGVELGAAKSQKDGKDIRDLMEQITTLKDVITNKDEEIKQLQQLRDTRSRYNGNSLSHSASCTIEHKRNLYDERVLADKKVALDQENYSEQSGEHSESGSQWSTDGRRHLKHQAVELNVDPELVSLGDADSEERLSEISDGILSMATETDASITSLTDLNLHEQVKSPEDMKDEMSRKTSGVSKPASHKTGQVPTLSTRSRGDLIKPPSAGKSTSRSTVASSKPPRRWQYLKVTRFRCTSEVAPSSSRSTKIMGRSNSDP
ncbi:kinesin-like protein KIN-14C [Curcuma longa]|uniref:kinesin-like protein KIN-14C n=1 Tax=Curcuma longa TaxID=136217 RepID=UPI003D9EE1CA